MALYSLQYKITQILLVLFPYTNTWFCKCVGLACRRHRTVLVNTTRSKSLPENQGVNTRVSKEKSVRKAIIKQYEAIATYRIGAIILLLYWYNHVYVFYKFRESEVYIKLRSKSDIL